jgi:inosine-uridine nucleoside N-ribohydrolase
MIDIVWDMETSDPDDFLTLIFLAGHPSVNLKAVTIMPGTAAQVGLVRHALNEWFKLDIPVGARKIDSEKQAVSHWHYDAYGTIPPSSDAAPADEVLRQTCNQDTTIVTGAPLTNIRKAILNSPEDSRFRVKSIVVQGGFAGEGVVPPELQMKKFKGLTTCPTYNLLGDKKAAQLVLEHEGFGIRRFVSKNVCHRVAYDQRMHDIFTQVKDKSQSLALIWQGMDLYLKKHREGKLLHDPLAACCAIDPSIATWAEVELYYEAGEWGARLREGSNTWIIIDYNREKFIEVFTAYE